uniref:Uncharacterized protein n=1 Tax=Arundo donax TaxID=35708 RepID=A0A0A8Y9X0_ARUDO
MLPSRWRASIHKSKTPLPHGSQPPWASQVSPFIIILRAAAVRQLEVRWR